MRSARANCSSSDVLLSTGSFSRTNAKCKHGYYAPPTKDTLRRIRAECQNQSSALRQDEALTMRYTSSFIITGRGTPTFRILYRRIFVRTRNRRRWASAKLLLAWKARITLRHMAFYSRPILQVLRPNLRGPPTCLKCQRAGMRGHASPWFLRARRRKGRRRSRFSSELLRFVLIICYLICRVSFFSTSANEAITRAREQ